MGKDKKHFDESLQETRTKNHSKLRFLKRVQEDEDAKKRMKEFLKWKELYDEDNEPDRNAD